MAGEDKEKQDTSLNPGAFAALQARFGQQSRRAQAYYTVMHELRRIVADDAAASAWMEAPSATLGGVSAAQAVAQGREEEVLAYVRSLKK